MSFLWVITLMTALCSATTQKLMDGNDTIFWNGTGALEQYLAMDNPLYSYENTGVSIEGVNVHGAWKGYILNMTSGSWLNESIVDHVIWWHYIVVIIPKELDSTEVAFFWTACADPGSNTNPSDLPKADWDDVIIGSFFATHGKIPSIVIYTNPNAPIVFSDDPNHKKRSSDSLLAYSFHETMFHPSMPPLFFPMYVILYYLCSPLSRVTVNVFFSDIVFLLCVTSENWTITNIL